jgi:hypothetical protein
VLHSTAISCLGAFPTPVSQRVADLVIAGVGKPAQKRKWELDPLRLWVRVKPSGVRSYIVQYSNRNSGASKRLTIGRHGPLLIFYQAKRQARAMLADAVRGEDPVELRKTSRRAPLRRGSRCRLSREALRSEEAPEERPR